MSFYGMLSIQAQLLVRSCNAPPRNEHHAISFDIGLQNVIFAPENRHIIANLEYLGFPVVSPGESPSMLYSYDGLSIDKIYIQALLWKMV
jgi:hypothetical protein